MSSGVIVDMGLDYSDKLYAPILQSTFPQASLTDHFISRWNQRASKCSWKRFCWYASNPFEMCIDEQKRSHWLYFDPNVDKWLVILVSHRRSFITVLTEEIYQTQINACSLVLNKPLCITHMKKCNQLYTGDYKFDLVYTIKPRKIIREHKHKFTLSRIFKDIEYIDAYILHKDPYLLALKLINTDLILNVINSIYKSNIITMQFVFGTGDDKKEIPVELSYE